jgi:hypothetical protein
VSATESVSMLAVCEMFSKRNENGISSDSRPDDSLDLYIDFLEVLNPYDWINDFELLELIELVFERRLIHR